MRSIFNSTGNLSFIKSLLLIAGLMLLLGISPVGASSEKTAPAEGLSVVGVVGKIPGRNLFVHLWAVVPPGENKAEVAREALARQGAMPLDSEDFSTTGLVWDQFLDRNTGNDAVTQFYNPLNDPTAGGLISLENTQAAWSRVAGSSFSFAYGGTTDRCPSLVLECDGPQTFDGKNDVGWVEIGGCCTLGVTWYSTTIDEADVALNSLFPWSVDGLTGYDLESVYLHENGHVAGLGHSNVAESVMLAYYVGVNRDLYADDEDGLRSLYPSTSNNQPPEISIQAPATGSDFPSGASVEFAATASDPEDGEITGGISWVSDLDGPLGAGGSVFYNLSDGNHTVTASVSDGNGETATQSITLSVGSAGSSVINVFVGSINYTTRGGKKSDKHLKIEVSIIDDAGAAVGGADVSIKVENSQAGITWTGSAVTGNGGQMSLNITNAPAGRYVTNVTEVDGPGLSWDGVTPPNETTK